MKRLMDAARRVLETAGLWRQDARLLVGVSGGADSMALLHTLCRLRMEMPFEVLAVHVQHGLRGEASIADERFVRDWCQRLSVPLQVESAGLIGDMHSPGIETGARQKRRAIFTRQMERLSADAVLLAHHRDDQAETVLMHLMRGAGADGLRGMREAAALGRGWMVRPFLAVSRDEIRQALSKEGLPYREDASNFEAVTARNILRLEILPKLEKLFPGAAEHVARSAQVIQADADALDAQAMALYQRALYDGRPLFMLNRRLLAEAPSAVGRRVLRLWWQDGCTRAGLLPDERSLGFEETLALEALEGSINLPLGLMAQTGRDWLHLLWQNGSYLLAQVDFEAPVWTEKMPHLTVSHGEAVNIPQSAQEIVLTAEHLAQKPVFRLMRPGDTIHPIGAPGAKPLRRYLTDQKVDPLLRAAWPVLALGSDIWWIPGLCAAETLRLNHIPNGSVRLCGVPDFCPEHA